MLFRKRKTEKTETSGCPDTMCGLDAVRTTEAVTSDALIVMPAPNRVGTDLNAPTIAARRKNKLIVREAVSTTELDGLVHGYAASGLRSAAIANAACAGNVMRNAYMPFVLHLAEYGAARRGDEDHGHAGYYAAANAGAFTLFASGVQDAIDLSLIAHHITEMALIPGVCAQDVYRTSNALRCVQLPDVALVETFLGYADDMIDAPTPSQRLLFGERRRRIPRLVDIDHPAGIGCQYDNDGQFRSAIARQSFFVDHVAPIADAAMHAYSALTGRNYSRLRAYRVDDADVVVVTHGAITQELCAVVDHLRAVRKVRAGVAEITMFHPFPGAALSHAIAGKTAVTVLDRMGGAFIDDAPLAAAVRNSIDRSTENAAARADDRPHPEYATMTLRERPQIFTGTYGARSSLPTFSDLAATVLNATTERRRRFYAGADFNRDYRRHPHLHTLQQRMTREYPEHASMSLPTLDVAVTENRSVVSIHALSSHGVLGAGNLFARVMADVLGKHVSTYPHGGLEPGLEPASIAIAYASTPGDDRTAPTSADVGVFANTDMLERSANGNAITPSGMAIVSSGDSPQTMWHRLSSRTAHWLKSRQIRLCTVDTEAIVVQGTARPTFIDQLTIWALLGAYVNGAEDIAGEGQQLIAEQLQGYVETETGLAWAARDIARAFSSGKDALHEIDWRAVDVSDSARKTEPTVPWTLDDAEHDGTAFDATRFWNSVGYLYETGESRAALVDPFTGSGVMPARSGTFRDVTPYRLRMPRWLPENCTGCGLCWATCPDSALPPTVQSLTSLLDTAIAGVEAEGKPATQIKRLHTHLAKNAYRIVASDDLSAHRMLGDLLGEALDQLLAKMELTDDNRRAIMAEFATIRMRVETYPVARTPVFFDAAHKTHKGDGQLLSIAVNAQSCKSCGLCVAVCPDNAFELTTQDADYLDQLRDGLAFHRILPPVTQSTIAAAEQEAAFGPVHRMLDTRAYHTMVGGDGAFPGTGEKTAVHLSIAAIESTSAPFLDAYIERLDALIEKLKLTIQGTVSSAVAINDFDAFARRLKESEHENLSAQELAEIAKGNTTSEGGRIRLLSDLLAKLEIQGHSFRDRARVVIAMGTEDVAYPYNPHANPWLAHNVGAGPAVAEALLEGIGASLAVDFATYRQAMRAIDGASPADNGDPRDWRDFDDDERALMPTVLVILREQDVDPAALRRALRADVPLKILVLVNSDAAAAGSIIPPTAPGAFCLQSSVSHPDHLISGVVEGVSHTGPALFRVLAPDPVTDDIAPESIVEQAGIAVSSRTFPLLRGLGETLSMEHNPSPESEWSERTMMFREPSGTIEEVRAPVTPADWAIGVGRFHREFSIVAKGHAAGHTRLLSEYVAMDKSQRADLTPYINVAGNGMRHMIAVPSASMVALAQRVYDEWRKLFAQDGVAITPQNVPEPVADAVTQTPSDPGAYQRLVDRLLWLSGFGQDPEFFAQSLGEFVVSQRNDEQDTSPADDRPTSTR